MKAPTGHKCEKGAQWSLSVFTLSNDSLCPWFFCLFTPCFDPPIPSQVVLVLCFVSLQAFSGFSPPVFFRFGYRF